MIIIIVIIIMMVSTCLFDAGGADEVGVLPSLADWNILLVM